MMKWFKKHLNWTWVFSWLLMQVIGLTSYWLIISGHTSIGGIVTDAGLISLLLLIFSFIFLLVISGWVIKQKGQNLAWIILVAYWSPVWLRNKNNVQDQIALMPDK
jgi:hypothetical protein